VPHRTIHPYDRHHGNYGNFIHRFIMSNPQKDTYITSSRPHCDIHSTLPRIHRFPRIVFNIVVSHEAWPLRGHCWTPQVSRALRRCRRDGFPPRLRSPGSGDEELLLRRGGRRRGRLPVDPPLNRKKGGLTPWKPIVVVLFAYLYHLGIWSIPVWCLR